jgi:hypothetical protein
MDPGEEPVEVEVCGPDAKTANFQPRPNSPTYRSLKIAFQKPGSQINTLVATQNVECLVWEQHGHVNNPKTSSQ